VDAVSSYSNAVRIGYARISGRSQDHQLQLDALAAAGCREVVVETASTRGERPKLRATLEALKPGDTLVIYKPDRVARSMKELLVLLEDNLHAKDINLHILTGICAGLHRPNSASIAEKMLFMVAAMAAEMERDLIKERTLDGLAAAEAQGRKGGRPPAVDPDTLAIAVARRGRGESVTAIARRLKVGRSTLYRALAEAGTEAPAAELPVTSTRGRVAQTTAPVAASEGLAGERLVRHVAGLARGVREEQPLAEELVSAARELRCWYDDPSGRSYLGPRELRLGWGEGPMATDPPAVATRMANVMHRVSRTGGGFLVATAAQVQNIFEAGRTPVSDWLGCHNLATLPRQLPADGAALVVLYDVTHPVAGLLSDVGRGEDTTATITNLINRIVHKHKQPWEH
jgi:DNA invertase Pin-like site-specific DNA recombinase